MLTKVQSTITALLLTLAPVALNAQVTTIYSDTFSGSATLLNGATTTSGGGTWSANSFVNQDGSLIGGSITGGAFLPVTLAVNNIYTLSMDIALTGTAASTKYIMMGFADQGTVTGPGTSNAAGRHNNATMNGYPVLALVTGSSLLQGTELYNSVVASTAFTDFANVHNYKLVLDTTGDGSTFTASYYVDNVAFGTSLLMDYANLSSIGGVGFSGRTTTGTVDNFLLTVQPVPEPSVMALIGLGLGGLVCVQRLRRK
jgi:hypothetical protein